MNSDRERALRVEHSDGVVIMIVDAHVHMGWDYTFDEDFTKEELIAKLKKLEVDVQIVQPSTCHDIDSVRAQHDAIATLTREYPGHFFGMANPSPHLPGTLYEEEVARCIEELGFVGIKLNPYGSGVMPNSRAGRKAFDAAQKYAVPLMVHTGAGMPFASPVNLIPLAQEYAGLKIILAHCGQTVHANEAEVAFAACSNTFGETSWTPGFIVRNWLRKYGHRFMLGSDQASNLPAETAKYESLDLSAEEKRAIYSETALVVYGLSDKAARIG